MQLIAQNLEISALNKSLDFLKRHPWYYPWQLFTWTWWLTTIPLSARIFAGIINGLTIRKSIFALLVFPVFCCLLWLSHEHFSTLAFHTFQSNFFLSWLPSLIFWSGSLILLGYCCFSNDYSQQLLTATYKDTSCLKKRRLPLKINTGVLQITLTLIMLYLIGGLFLLSRFYFAVAATGIAVYALISMGLLKTLRRQKPNSRN